MDKNELIKLGLEEETADKVIKLHKDTIDGAFVTKTRFNEVNTELGTLKTTLADRDGQLEKLKNSTGDVEVLKQQIIDLQAENTKVADAHAEEIKQLKINAAVDAALTAANSKNNKAVRALLEDVLEKAELADDGTVKGLSDAIKKLAGAEDSKFLFATDTKKTLKGAVPAETGNEVPGSKIDVSKMSYEELSAWMAENPGVEI